MPITIKKIFEYNEIVSPDGSELVLVDDGTGNYFYVQMSNISSTPTALTQLADPVLTATVVSSTEIDLDWTNVANESSYVLQRSTDERNWSTIASPAVNVVAFSDTGLTPGTLYYYRVKAIGNGTTHYNSDYGYDQATSTALITLDTPTLTATVISDTQIDLSWTNVANESSYKLEWSPNGTTGWTQIGGTIAANTTSYSHTGLTASTAYYYRITAVGDGVTYSNSAYGTDNDTTNAGTENITWSQLAQTTNSGSGTITGNNSTTPAGGTATKKLTKANGNYVEYTVGATVSDSETVVFILTSSNDAYYVWDGSQDLDAAVYHFSGDYKAIAGTAASSPTSLGLAPATNDVVRLEITNTDDVLVKVNGVTEHTFSGALTGITDIFIKAVFAVNSSGKSIELCRGAGLVTI